MTGLDLPPPRLRSRLVPPPLAVKHRRVRDMKQQNNLQSRYPSLQNTPRGLRYAKYSQRLIKSNS